MNVNTKELLTYVISVLEEYGIVYMGGQDIVKAKKNEPGGESKLIRLLFDLCVLQMFDFDIRLDAIELQGSDETMRQVILAHLCEMECPYLVEIGQNRVGLNFESSRELLICVGWVMATADIFGRFEEKVLMRAIKQIEEINPDTLEKGPPKNPTQTSIQKPIDFRVEDQSINSLHKILLSRLGNIDNLRQKKTKVKRRIEVMLREANRNESIQELLSNDKSYQRIKQERTTKLSELIEKEMKLMRYRKPFWAWMETVIKAEKDETQSEAFQQQPSRYIDKFVVDTNKLSDFAEKCSVVERLYETHQERFEALEACWKQRFAALTDKEKKELNTESRRIQEQVNEQIPTFQPGASLKVNSFIGIQLQRHIYPQQEDFEETHEDNTEETANLKKLLLKLCEQNIENLEDYKFL